VVILIKTLHPEQSHYMHMEQQKGRQAQGRADTCSHSGIECTYAILI
jgi:hypothetical protein